MNSNRNFFTALGTDTVIPAERDNLNQPLLLKTSGTVLDPVPVSYSTKIFILDAKFDFPFKELIAHGGKLGLALFGFTGFADFFRGKAFGFLAPGTGFKPALCGGILALTLFFPQTVFPQEVSSDFGHDQAGEHVKEFADSKSEKDTQPEAGDKSGSGVRIHSEVNGIGNELSVHSKRVLFKFGFILGTITGIISGIYIIIRNFARRFLR